MPAVRRRGTTGGGRVAPRLPGHGHHGGQALVLLEVTSLSVYILSLSFRGSRRLAVFCKSCGAGEPPPFREARCRPRVPRTAGGRRNLGSSLPGVTMNAYTRPELHGRRIGQPGGTFNSRPAPAVPPPVCLLCCKLRQHPTCQQAAPTRAIGRWTARFQGAHSGTRLEALLPSPAELFAVRP